MEQVSVYDVVMAPLELAGSLAQRRDRPLGDRCPIERAMQVVGSRSAMLLLREVFYGATRFDVLVARVGVTEAVASRWLKELVFAGVLEKVPYREPGQRTRHEYSLSEAGHALMPVVLGLLEWGAAWTGAAGYDGPAVSHRGCGEPVQLAVRCAAGHDVPEEEIVVTGRRADASAS
jgi:DNA-binding HxlR family transcriptional regulator